MKTHPIQIGAVHRELKIVNLGAISVALLNLLGDTELTEAAASELIAKMPVDVEVFVAPEVKAVPLAHAMSAKAGLPYVVVRKTQKPYMLGSVKKSVTSITTGKPQDLVIDGEDVKRLEGKKVAIVDDVVSTGNTLKGLLELLTDMRAMTVATLAVFTEGSPRDDVIALGHLPLFDKEDGITA